MTVDQILTFARSQTHTTTSQFASATIIDWANIVYRDLIRSIVAEVDQNFFTTTKVVDAVADQEGYDLEADVLEVKTVRIKPTTTATDWVKSREVDFSKLPEDMEWYMVYQSIDDPIHQMIGQKLYIAPKFVAATVNGVDNNQIEYDYEQRQTALSVGGAESTVKIPLDYHHLIAIGTKQYIYSALGKTNEKNDAANEYANAKADMLYILSGRDDTKNYITIPSDTSLE